MFFFRYCEIPGASGLRAALHASAECHISLLQKDRIHDRVQCRFVENSSLQLYRISNFRDYFKRETSLVQLDFSNIFAFKIAGKSFFVLFSSKINAFREKVHKFCSATPSGVHDGSGVPAVRRGEEIRREEEVGRDEANLLADQGDGRCLSTTHLSLPN